MSGTKAKVDGIQIEDWNLPVQARFLAAVSLLNPEVLLSLKEVSEAQTRLPTRRALKMWARRWNIEADWIVEWAAHTVEWQRKGPNRCWERFFHPRWSLTSRFERRPPNIDMVIKRRIGAVDFGEWLGDPTTQSEAQLRAARAFQEILKESLEEVGATAVRSGLFESLRRRSRSIAKTPDAPKRSENEPFLWLAGYQTRGWSRERIAEAVDVTRNAVAMRIDSLAAELKIKFVRTRRTTRARQQQKFASKSRQRENTSAPANRFWTRNSSFTIRLTEVVSRPTDHASLENFDQ